MSDMKRLNPLVDAICISIIIASLTLAYFHITRAENPSESAVPAQVTATMLSGMPESAILVHSYDVYADPSTSHPLQAFEETELARSGNKIEVPDSALSYTNVKETVYQLSEAFLPRITLYEYSYDSEEAAREGISLLDIMFGPAPDAVGTISYVGLKHESIQGLKHETVMLGTTEDGQDYFETYYTVVNQVGSQVELLMVYDAPVGEDAASDTESLFVTLANERINQSKEAPTQVGMSNSMVETMLTPIIYILVAVAALILLSYRLVSRMNKSA